jgi:hypothetical protein
MRRISSYRVRPMATPAAAVVCLSVALSLAGCQKNPPPETKPRNVDTLEVRVAGATTVIAKEKREALLEGLLLFCESPSAARERLETLFSDAGIAGEDLDVRAERTSRSAVNGESKASVNVAIRQGKVSASCANTQTGLIK